MEHTAYQGSKTRKTRHRRSTETTKATGTFHKAVDLLYHKSRQLHTLTSNTELKLTGDDVQALPTPPQLNDQRVQASFWRESTGLGRKENSCPPGLCSPPLSSGSESLQNHSIPKAPPRFRTLEFHLKEFQNKRHDSKKFKKHKCKGGKVIQIRWKSLSCVQLFATPWTIQFMGFSRPEYWSG